MASYLITGTSKGLGLQLVKALAARPSDQVSLIIATSRILDADIKQVTDSSDRVHHVFLDVTLPDSLAKATKAVERLLGKAGLRGLDMLINNAGVTEQSPAKPPDLASDELTRVWRTNVEGTHSVTCAFLPLLRRSDAAVKKVVNLTTTMGTFTGVKSNPWWGDAPLPAYKITKAALHMLTVEWANSLKTEPFIVTAVTPGWLKTRLGGGDAADITAEQGAYATLEVVDSLTKEDSGNLRLVKVQGHYEGGRLPW